MDIINSLKNILEKSPVFKRPLENYRDQKFIKKNKWMQEEDFKSILDVGANNGQFAKNMRLLFATTDIYSFEPIPSVFEELKENFKDDKYFQAFNFGLGERDEEKAFFLNDFSFSSSFLQMNQTHKDNFPLTVKENKITVKMKKLDEVIDIKKIKKPYLLKLDVQGYEKNVIDGGMGVASGADYIITEVSFAELYDGQILFDEMYSLMKSLGFEYVGNYEQLLSPINGTILQADAIFKKIR